MQLKCFIILIFLWFNEDAFPPQILLLCIYRFAQWIPPIAHLVSPCLAFWCTNIPCPILCSKNLNFLLTNLCAVLNKGSIFHPILHVPQISVILDSLIQKNNDSSDLLKISWSAQYLDTWWKFYFHMKKGRTEVTPYLCAQI